MGGRAVRAGDALLVAGIVLLPLVAAFQGLDFTDTGWLATNYQLIFDHPESIRYWFHLWLTNIFGGLWYRAVPLGLLGLKLGAAVVFWASCALVWKTLRSVTSWTVLLAAMLLAYGFQVPRVSVVYYNNLTALFHFAAVLCLCEGLKAEGPWLLAASGAIEGLNLFVRLPNVLGLALVLVVVFSAMLGEVPLETLWRRLLAFFAGYVAGILCVVSVMAAMGHLSLYAASVRDLFGSVQGELTSYSPYTMVRRFVRQNGHAAILGLGALAGVAVLAVLLPKRPRLCEVLVGLGGMAAFAAAALLARADANLMRLALGMIYVPLALGIVVLDETHNELRIASFASLLVLLVLSVGSDTGTVVSVYGYTLAFPLVLSVSKAASASGASRAWLPMSRLDLRRILHAWVPLFASFAALGSCYLLATGTYRDSADRLEMRHSVDHRMLAGVLTTPERAREVQGVLDALSGRVRPGDTLLALESIPMIHFATQTKPYLGNGWPNLFTRSELEQALEWAGQRSTPPIVVRATRNTRSRYWPKNLALDMGGASVAVRERIERFLDLHGYRTVWRNEMFEVLEPADERAD